MDGYTWFAAIGLVMCATSVTLVTLSRRRHKQFEMRRASFAKALCLGQEASVERLLEILKNLRVVLVSEMQGSPRILLNRDLLQSKRFGKLMVDPTEICRALGSLIHNYRENAELWRQVAYYIARVSHRPNTVWHVPDLSHLLSATTERHPSDRNRLLGFCQEAQKALEEEERDRKISEALRTAKI
jgi:hypothetical protein